MQGLERYEEALATFDRSLRLLPDEPLTLSNRGDVLWRRLGRYEEGLATLDRSLELRPDDPGTLTSRGGALGNMERYEEALGAFNRSLELRPDDPDTLYMQGLALSDLERYLEGLAALNRSLELRPDDPDTLNSRGRALGMLGRHEEALGALREHYDSEEHAFELVEVADGFQLLTRPEFAEAIAQARIVSRPRRLTAAALETLAIIAYRQPVGRAEIEDIRGVAADGVLRSLHERGLIDVVGRGDGLGRPLLYGTTSRFLEMMGLTEVSELPRLEQLAVALRPLAGPGFGADDVEPVGLGAEVGDTTGGREDSGEL